MHTSHQLDEVDVRVVLLDGREGNAGERVGGGQRRAERCLHLLWRANAKAGFRYWYTHKGQVATGTYAEPISMADLSCVPGGCQLPQQSLQW